MEKIKALKVVIAVEGDVRTFYIPIDAAFSALSLLERLLSTDEPGFSFSVTTMEV